MASGRFGSASLTAATLTQLCAGPAAGNVRTVNVLLVNQGAAAATVSIAVSASATSGGVVAGDYVTYGFTLAGQGAEYEKTGLVIGSTEYVWVQASTASVSARAHGFEGAA